jgi:hypothetical protein
MTDSAKPEFPEWRSLWRESISLRRAEGDAPVVASAAGDPPLPPEAEWPRGGDDVPLEHLMTLRLSALPRIGIDLPDRGLLLFFIDVEYEEPEVLYFEDSAGLRLRDRPEDAEGAPRDRIDLMAVLEPTWPGPDHPYLGGFPKSYFKGFHGVIAELDLPEPPSEGDHRIGGYHAFGAQYDFPCAPGSTIPDLPGTPDPEALELPILLARMGYDPDAGMHWGDCGSAEWTISRDDLAARRFEQVEFSWSCY